MIEQVKMSIDEQTRLTLRQLQETFAELLSPLNQLEKLSPAADAGDNDFRRELQKVANAVSDVSDDVLRKLKAVEDAQQSLYSRIANVAEEQRALLAKFDDFSAAIANLIAPPKIQVSSSAPESKPEAKSGGTMAKKVAAKSKTEKKTVSRTDKTAAKKSSAKSKAIKKGK